MSRPRDSEMRDGSNPSDEEPSNKRQKQNDVRLLVLTREGMITLHIQRDLPTIDLHLMIARKALDLSEDTLVPVPRKMYIINRKLREARELCDGPLLRDLQSLDEVDDVSDIIDRAERGVVHLFYDHPPPTSDLAEGIFFRFPPAAPSSRSKPSVFRSAQENSPLLHCNRPSTTSPLPVTLIHRSFSEFIDDCEHSQPTPEDHALLTDLIAGMSTFYDHEDPRAAKFRRIMASHGIHLVVAQIEGSKYQTDGHALLGRYIYLITECKNEIAADSTAEPMTKAALYYFEYLRNLKDSTETPLPWPCLHIVYAGPTIWICGSGFSDRVHFDVLTVIPLHFHDSDDRLRFSALRTIRALRNTVASLQGYYQELDRQLQPNGAVDDLDPRYPYVRSYKCLTDNRTKHFIYTTQPMASKLIFLAKCKENQKPLFIKFVRHYSKDAHSFCAQRKAAPQLLGYEELPGGWAMVVMEDVDPTNYRPYVDASKKSGFKFTSADILRNALQDTVLAMHDAGFVHGDLRDINLLVRNEASSHDGPAFLLCDFDWAGHVGEVRYPYDINRQDITRPKDAVGGFIITKEHDMEMVELIFE